MFLFGSGIPPPPPPPPFLIYYGDVLNIHTSSRPGLKKTKQKGFKYYYDMYVGLQTLTHK